jgi:hypothetical protein
MRIEAFRGTRTSVVVAARAARRVGMPRTSLLVGMPRAAMGLGMRAAMGVGMRAAARALECLTLWLLEGHALRKRWRAADRLRAAARVGTRVAALPIRMRAAMRRATRAVAPTRVSAALILPGTDFRMRVRAAASLIAGGVAWLIRLRAGALFGARTAASFGTRTAARIVAARSSARVAALIPARAASLFRTRTPALIRTRTASLIRVRAAALVRAQSAALIPKRAAALVRARAVVLIPTRAAPLIRAVALLRMRSRTCPLRTRTGLHRTRTAGRPGARSATRVGRASVRRRGGPCLETPRLQLAILDGFLPGPLQQRVELAFVDLLERAEIGARQCRPFEVAQQAGAVASLLGLEDALLAFEVAALLVERAPLLVDRAPSRELVDRAAAVLVADLAGRLTVQVEPVRTLRDRLQIRRAAGVAAEERGQRLLREHAGRTLLDVDLDAQLQRLRRAPEQGREALAQQRSAVALHRPRLG